MKPPKQKEAIPDVMVGDRVFFQHPQGARSGRVDACGKQGATIKCEGQHHRVKWDKVLGHKRLANQRMNVIERGHDGIMVEDAGGTRRFLYIPREERDDSTMSKAYVNGRLITLVNVGEPLNRSQLPKETDADDES